MPPAHFSDILSCPSDARPFLPQKKSFCPVQQQNTAKTHITFLSKSPGSLSLFDSTVRCQSLKVGEKQSQLSLHLHRPAANPPKPFRCHLPSGDSNRIAKGLLQHSLMGTATADSRYDPFVNLKAMGPSDPRKSRGSKAAMALTKTTISLF